MVGNRRGAWGAGGGGGRGGGCLMIGEIYKNEKI